MHRLSRFLHILAYGLVAGLVSGLFFYFYQFAQLAHPSYALHYYEAPDSPIANIHLKVIYFVPKDRAINQQWESDITAALKNVRSFHHREFGNYGTLKYEIYPTPVRGEHEIAFYDSEDTARGNRHALEAILREVNERVFRKGGDLYSVDFAEQTPQEFRVKVFIYEGIGAMGGHHSIILAREYLTKTRYGATTLYHELLHTFGVPDSYDYGTNIPFSDDIMGSGREKPIYEAYIRDEIKRALGASLVPKTQEEGVK